MRKGSAFLFDDRDYFYYGEVLVEEVEYVDDSFIQALRKVRNQTMNYLVQPIVIVSLALGTMSFVSNMGASSPAHMVVKSGAKVGEENEDYLRKNFIINREFLGLKQSQVAQILDLSESTVEKFEQGVYPTQMKKTKEMIAVFNEWVSVLREYHGDRKFVVRPLIKAKMDSLGDISPLDYAKLNPGEGLYDLIGLERKMYG